MSEMSSYTYDDGRTVSRRDDGTWVNEYGEQVGDPRDGDVRIAEFGYTDGNAGSWESGGSEVYGVEAEVSTVEFRYEDADDTDYGVTVGGFSGEAYVGEDEFSLGAGATAVSFTAEGGEWDANRAGETRVTGGLSAGPSAGLHATYGTDHDGDGRNEYGAEVDALFFKVGYVTEESEAGSISQLDDRAVDYASEQYDAAAQYADETYQSVETAVEDGYATAGQYATEGYDSAGQYAAESYDSASQYASETYDSASQYASETYDSAASTASETYDSAASTASESYESAASTASETYESVTDWLTGEDE
jgi:hypothetical protein